MTTDTEFSPGPTALHPAGLFWFAAAVLSALPLFWYGLVDLADDWSRPEYSHGPVIPLLSFYMFLREMKEVPPTTAPVRDRWPGVMVLGAGLMLALAGNIVQLSDLVFYALIIWTGGLVLTCFGWKRGIVFWPSVLHLVFMLPLPQFIYWKINTILQLISSEIGVALVQLAGVPVFLEGNIIDLGVYKLQVAEACSGLRYLFPIMSFTYVFAVLYRGQVWHKLVLLLSAIPIAVLMNSVRIGIIGILVDRYGIEQAEGFLHVFEGWVIFLACIGLLFGMAIAMQRLSGDKRPLSEALEMDFSGLSTQVARIRTIPAAPALIAAACMTATLAGAFSLTPQRETYMPDRDPFSLFPHRLEGWSGRTATLDPVIASVLGADDYLSAWYTSPDESTGVDFFLSYYTTQTEGSAIHSPEVCLPGAGWEVSTIRTVDMTLSGTKPFRANRAIIQKGLNRQLVYYWFEGRGRRMTGDFSAKISSAIDNATLGRTDGGLVRVITPIGEGGMQAAEARLKRFLEATVPRLPGFIPGQSSGA